MKIEKLIAAVEELLPDYLANPADVKNNKGNTAICIIDEHGQVYGKMFGDDKIIKRNIYRIAWTKASQVWITGINTGEYEKLVFNKQIDEHQFGIERPDLIGWEGGQLITLKDGTRLSVGFSGMRGISDLGIITRAVASIDL
jgi:glc operon protein GlcG